MIFAAFAFAVTAGGLAIRAAGDCPSVPDDHFIFGRPIDMISADVPNTCSEFEIIVARGTSEPNFIEGGKFGVIVGDPIVSNVSLAIAGVQGYPVQYPADGNFAENIKNGARDITERIKSRASKCPQQTFALVGYSQGAGLVHRAAGLLPPELGARIKSISVFGDPSEGENEGRVWPASWPYGLHDKVRHVCASGDPICDVTATCFYVHLTYIRPMYIDPAVNFIVDSFINTGRKLPATPHRGASH